MSDNQTTEAANPERFEVQRPIPATPESVFAVLCDPGGHVAIDASGMLISATGEAVAAVDDKFVVHMDREAKGDVDLGKYDATVRIVKFEQDREIAWTVEGDLNIGHIYGYSLKPSDGGTLATSYYDWSMIADEWKQSGVFPVISDGGLKSTLGILERVLTTDAYEPPRRD